MIGAAGRGQGRIGMVRVVWAGLAALLLLVLAAAPGARAQDPCAGLVEARLEVGGAARVLSAVGLSLKDRPTTGSGGAAEVAQVPPGMVFAVTGGPTCSQGYRWWPVALPDGRAGWAAEGDASGYFVEPVTVGLTVFRPLADGSGLARSFVTPDGAAISLGAIPIPPVAATPAELWQPVEVEALTALLDRARAECPQRLIGTPFAGLASAADALDLPLPPSDYDVYPSPDGERLVLVRHFHLLAPRCDTAVPERVGISTVSVVGTDGSVSELFPFPQHGSVPASEDRYGAGEPSEWNVTLDEVVWSPQGTHVAFVAAYRDTCAGEACTRFQVYVANLQSGQLYVLGDGRHVAWGEGGARLTLFRRVGTVTHLFALRPDGTERQEIWLPGGAAYVSAERDPLGLPWDAGGAQLLVSDAAQDAVMLFTVTDRAFSAPIPIPDRMTAVNRLSVEILPGGRTLLWTTIRGEFAVQQVRGGEWTPLASELASTGVAPRRVRPFASGQAALIEMADGAAYVLDLSADRLIPVVFGAP